MPFITCRSTVQMLAAVVFAGWLAVALAARTPIAPRVGPDLESEV